MISHLSLALVIVTSIMAGLAITAVGLRFYCRRLQKVPYGLDDYFILIALFLSTGVNIISIYVLFRTGIAYTDSVQTKEDVVIILKIAFAVEPTQAAAVGICKVSLLLFYRRIFSLPWFRRASFILMIVVSCFTFAVVMSIIFSKWPIHEQWNPQAPYDLNFGVLFMVFTAQNAVFDLIILSLPLFAISRVQIALQRKIFLSVLFTLGSVCVVASLFRLYYAVQSLDASESNNKIFKDSYMYNSLWANIEAPGFILTSCLLLLGPLFRGLQKHLTKTLSYLQSVCSRRDLLRETSSVPKEGIQESFTLTQVPSHRTMERQGSKSFHMHEISPGRSSSQNGEA